MKVEVTLYGKKETIQASEKVLNYVSYAFGRLEETAKKNCKDLSDVITGEDAGIISNELYNALNAIGYYNN